MKTYRVETERRVLGGTQFYCECPDGEYVPAKVARGLLEALKRVVYASDNGVAVFPTMLAQARNAIAAAEAE